MPFGTKKKTLSKPESRYYRARMNEMAEQKARHRTDFEADR